MSVAITLMIIIDRIECAFLALLIANAIQESARRFAMMHTNMTTTTTVTTIFIAIAGRFFCRRCRCHRLNVYINDDKYVIMLSVSIQIWFAKVLRASIA